ncbi:hypothetical protein LEP1GSC126_3381 [Leptospira kirschneri str. 200801774]|uniref:hypothetical protein n=1 Tax=Leptospira kirschneri TaxID=29507 RepID=UPI0002BE9FA1|nr:hypothetical protein [Leptospira kirschneri]EMO80220.1 hypothetical protein LEP1GSC126_3381 [Leptospira kirschneri str. 200801774]
MNETETLKINDILKLIEIETGPDNPASASFCAKIKSDPNSARFALEVAHFLIKDASSNEDLFLFLVYLASTAAVWISVLSPGEVKTKGREESRINNILKSIEEKIEPDSLLFAEARANITNDANFAKSSLSGICNLIKSAKDDKELTIHLLALVCLAVILISTLNPTEIKECVNRKLGSLSPWAHQETVSETTK